MPSPYPPIFHRALGHWRHDGLAPRQGDSGSGESYARCVILAIALSGISLSIVSGLIWTARLLHVSNLDAQALAEKTAYPVPASAVEWPELHVQFVIPQPEDLSPVILHVCWPAHPGEAATLLVALDQDKQHALSLLSQWCSAEASVSAIRGRGAELELRRRQSLERVHAILLAEDYQAC
jgi:hypothetical protein